MPDTVQRYLDTISAARVVYVYSSWPSFLSVLSENWRASCSPMCAVRMRQDRLDSHYRFQIRTFWIGWLYILIAFAVIVSSIGFVFSSDFGLMGLMIAAGSAGWIFGVIWTIIRCIKGLIYELRNEPYPNPGTWFF